MTLSFVTKPQYEPKLCAWEGPFCRGSRMNLQLVPMGSLAISKQAAIVFHTIINEQNKLRKKKRKNLFLLQN